MPTGFTANVNHRLTGKTRHRFQRVVTGRFRRKVACYVVLEVEEEYDLVDLPFDERVKSSHKQWRDAHPDDFLKQVATPLPLRSAA